MEQRGDKQNKIKRDEATGSNMEQDAAMLSNAKENEQNVAKIKNT